MRQGAADAGQRGAATADAGSAARLRRRAGTRRLPGLPDRRLRAIRAAPRDSFSGRGRDGRRDPERRAHRAAPARAGDDRRGLQSASTLDAAGIGYSAGVAAHGARHHRRAAGRWRHPHADQRPRSRSQPRAARQPRRMAGHAARSRADERIQRLRLAGVRVRQRNARRADRRDRCAHRRVQRGAVDSVQAGDLPQPRARDHARAVGRAIRGSSRRSITSDRTTSAC